MVKLQIKIMQLIKIFTISLSFLIMLSSCNETDKNFKTFLFELADVPEQNRQAVLDTWMNKVYEFPIVEDTLVYFIYRNEKDMPVFLTGDMNSWQKGILPLLRIIGTDYYYCEYHFPLDARVEYKFIAGDQFVNDPYNERRSGGGYGENSLLMMPDYEFPSEILAKRSVIYTKLDTAAFRQNKTSASYPFYFYRHDSSSNTSPLVVFTDGSDYINFAQAPTILDNLIRDNKIPAINALFVDPKDRMKEYWMDESFTTLLIEEILPFVRKEYQINPDNTYLGGVSLGGLFSLYALKNYSSELAGVFSQSGAIWVDSLRILDELKNADFSNVKLYYSYGSFENQDSVHHRLNTFLTKKSARFSWDLFHEGHAWGSWKGHLDNALIYLLNKRKSGQNAN
ncbi:MAG: hypothetical protein H6627_04425 [Calditrichae bacterium]|nr:hypothetical protein [Calditrichia bacterium]